MVSMIISVFTPCVHATYNELVNPLTLCVQYVTMYIHPYEMPDILYICNLLQFITVDIHV